MGALTESGRCSTWVNRSPSPDLALLSVSSMLLSLETWSKYGRREGSKTFFPLSQWLSQFIEQGKVLWGGCGPPGSRWDVDKLELADIWLMFLAVKWCCPFPYILVATTGSLFYQWKNPYMRYQCRKNKWFSPLNSRVTVHLSCISVHIYIYIWSTGNSSLRTRGIGLRR